jgi:hypothetical protein
VSGAGEPAPTITTKDRLGLISVTIKGTLYVIVDICLRMLQKHDYSAMRVDAESQYYAWEFEAIKDAILDGTLTYTPTLLRKAWPTIAERTCIDR